MYMYTHRSESSQCLIESAWAVPRVYTLGSTVPIMDPRHTASNKASEQRQFSQRQDSEVEGGDISVNHPYGCPQGQVCYDRELLTGGFSFETGTSHYTRLGLPNQPSPRSNSEASSSPDSVIHIDVSV